MQITSRLHPKVVIDIEGIISDVGMPQTSGLASAVSGFETVARVCVDYAMPHFHSIALGGRSLSREANGK